MRSYTAICNDGRSTDLLMFQSMSDIQDKLPSIMDNYKTVIVKTNGKFICKYYIDNDFGVMRASKVKER